MYPEQAIDINQFIRAQAVIDNVRSVQGDRVSFDESSTHLSTEALKIPLFYPKEIDNLNIIDELKRRSGDWMAGIIQNLTVSDFELDETLSPGHIYSRLLNLEHDDSYENRIVSIKRWNSLTKDTNLIIWAVDSAEGSLHPVTLNRWGIEELTTKISMTAALARISESFDISEKYNRDIYNADDESIIIEFIFDNGRVSCVLRDGYANIISVNNKGFDNKVFVNESYDLNDIIAHISNMLSVYV